MSKKRAAIFDIWDDTRREQGVTIDKLAKKTGIDFKWLQDFFNKGVLADQVSRVKKIEKELGIPPMDIDRWYVSERSEQE